ncbi:MAG: biotin/lipoyl-binding protein [Chloroflexi bacterium]|nr:biotin/lipoyl-binding protein [Chloroflexota bacterium]
MKYKITVNNQTYEVEIENINSRPVIAVVDGDRFEVMPENAEHLETRKEAGSTREAKPFDPHPAPAAASSPNPALSGNTQTAPLPGTVIEVFVKAGEKVEAGQVVVIIEAMKMKNSIRSVYSGVVSNVFVSVGQSVAHKQPLIKFAEMGEASWM